MQVLLYVAMFAYLCRVSINFLNRAFKTPLKEGDLIGIQFTTVLFGWRRRCT